MRRIFIDSHNPHSQGARRLAEYLNARRIRQTGSRYRPRRSDVVINWGRSELGSYARDPLRWDGIPNIINDKHAVGVASDKLAAFQRFHNTNESIRHDVGIGNPISHPEWTDSLETAKTWVKEGHLIVSRSLLRASEGRGMEIANYPVESILGVPVRLWVKYKRKSREYRVHVFRGEVIDIQQKKRDRESEIDEQIRSHANGWVFAREGILDNPEIPVIKEQAILAVKALGLDFGAVDIIYSKKKNTCWVLEVNCAPGLEGTTVASYGDAIRRYIGEMV